MTRKGFFQMIAGGVAGSVSARPLPSDGVETYELAKRGRVLTVKEARALLSLQSAEMAKALLQHLKAHGVEIR